MADEKFTFEQARIRLEEIAAEVRKKDTSLEKSLDLLEEGVRLANICTELVDHTDTGAGVTTPAPEAQDAKAVADDGSEADDHAADSDPADARQDTRDAGDADDASDDDAGAYEGDGFDEVDDEVDEPADIGVGD